MTVKCSTKKYRKAAKFYAKTLGIPDDIKVLIWTKKKIKKALGYCSQVNEKTYIIALQTKKEKHQEDPLAILAHEMVHVKQYALGELVDEGGYCLWHGERIEDRSGMKHYYFSPWEIEAYGRSVGLHHLYCKHMSKYF